MNDFPRARRAADELLARKVADGSMNQATAGAMAVAFNVTTSTLADLRRSGMSEAAITDAYLDRLAQARRLGDVRSVIAAEFTLAVWGGLQDDLAEHGTRI